MSDLGKATIKLIIAQLHIITRTSLSLLCNSEANIIKPQFSGAYIIDYP